MSINRFSLALNSSENERYLVRKGVDMLALLRALAARRAPVALYFGEADDFLHTELLGINPAYEELLLSPGGDHATLARLLAAGSFGVETSLDSVRVMFIATHAEITQFRGQNALRARIPEVMARMQRRESVRVTAPKDPPSFCTLRAHANPRDAGGGELRLRVPPGTQAGQRFRLSGRGVPTPAGTRGDLVVEVKLVLPQMIDERSKDLMREFGKLNSEDVRRDLHA